jgi:hypothetical protein
VSVNTQAKEAEEGRTALERKAQELGYANRKLAAELDTAHDAARSAAERDRRALRMLREGLAAVGRWLVKGRQGRVARMHGQVHTAGPCAH